MMQQHHPPDPTMPKRHVHVSMKVSIMTDGPGGVDFHQSVNTPGYAGDQLEASGYQGYPYNAVGFNGFEPANNMITWPEGACAHTQTDEPIVQMPGDTTKDSEEDKKKSRHRHHHHRHHKRSKSGSGYDSRSQSSMSVIKYVLNDSQQKVPSEKHSSRSRHKSVDSSSSRKSRSRPSDSVHHFGNTRPLIPPSLLTPRIVPYEEAHLQQPEQPRRTVHSYPSEESTFLSKFPGNYLNHNPVYNFPSSIASYTPDIVMNTFNERRMETTFEVIEERNAFTQNIPVITEPSQGSSNKSDSSGQVSFEQNSTSQISLPSKSGKSKPNQSVDGVEMGIQCYGLPQPQSTQTDEQLASVHMKALSHALSAPQFMSVLDPIVKLTEQLAANMKDKIIITEKTETEVTTYTEKYEPNTMLTVIASQPEVAKRQTRYICPTDKLTPLETLINDVGVESKEIQTVPEKVTIGTSMSSASSNRSKSSSMQTVTYDDDSDANTKESFQPKQTSMSKKLSPSYIPFETLIDDVGVESKEIQTLPEKVSFGTDTHDLTPAKEALPKVIHPQKERLIKEDIRKYSLNSYPSVQVGSERSIIQSVDPRIYPGHASSFTEPFAEFQRSKTPDTTRTSSRGYTTSPDKSVPNLMATKLDQTRIRTPLLPEENFPAYTMSTFNDLPVHVGYSDFPSFIPASEEMIEKRKDVHHNNSCEESYFSLQSRDQAVFGIKICKETNIDDVLRQKCLQYETQPKSVETMSPSETRPKSIENFAYESATPHESFDQESDSSTVNAYSVTSSRSAHSSNAKSPKNNNTSKPSVAPDLPRPKSRENDMAQQKINNSYQLFRDSEPAVKHPAADRLNSVDSVGSGRQTSLDERLAKHTSQMKRMRQDFFITDEIPIPNSIAVTYAQPISSLEQMLQNRLKNGQKSPTQLQQQSESSKNFIPSSPFVASPPQTPLENVSKPLPPPPPPPPPSVISKIPVPKPTSPSQNNDTYEPKQYADKHSPLSNSFEEQNILLNTSSAGDDDPLQYREFVVKHRLMPSAKIFEIHTKNPVILQYNRSPRSSYQDPGNGGTYKTITEESETQSVVSERSSVSGRIGQTGGMYTLVDASDVQKHEKLSEYNENLLTPANMFITSTVDSRYESGRSEESVMKITSYHFDKGHSIFNEVSGKYDNSSVQSMEKANEKATFQSYSPRSIDTERSSLSGAERKGAYNVSDACGYMDENFSDYQDHFSPCGRRSAADADNSSYGRESLTANSLASITSLKADQIEEIYSTGLPIPPAAPYPSSVRSFADIMGRLPSATQKRVNSGSPNGSKTMTSDNSIDREGSGVYVIRPERPLSIDNRLDESSSTVLEENVKHYTQGRISPMDNNYDSRTSTLTSYGDFETESFRVAKLVTRPSLNLSREGIFQGQGFENKLTPFQERPYEPKVTFAEKCEIFETEPTPDEQASSGSAGPSRRFFMQTEL